MGLSRELERADPDLNGTEKPGSMSLQQWKRYQSERSQRHGSSTAFNAVSGAEQLRKMNDIMEKYEISFSKHLQILLDCLNHYAATETVVLLGLCARLSTTNQGTQYAGPDKDNENLR